jgi:hypothetical protein
VPTREKAKAVTETGTGVVIRTETGTETEIRKTPPLREGTMNRAAILACASAAVMGERRLRTPAAATVRTEYTGSKCFSSLSLGLTGSVVLKISELTNLL